jgi:hypothetical protein
MSADAWIEAVERGDLAAISTALKADPSLARATTRDGDTLLHLACWQKQAAIVREILGYAPDLDARGWHGRTPLHYAVHEGGPESVPIVAALLAGGADPSIVDDGPFTVAEWANIDMVGGLEDVLALLGAPPAPAAAAEALRGAAERDAREPTVREAGFHLGPPDRGVSVRAWRSHDASGTYATALSVTIAAPTRDGGTVSAGCFPRLGSSELAAFAASLVALRALGSGTAALDVPEAHGLHVEITARRGRFQLEYAVAHPIGPPGTVDGPPSLDLAVDDAWIDARAREILAMCAALDAWSAADRGP